MTSEEWLFSRMPPDWARELQRAWAEGPTHPEFTNVDIGFASAVIALGLVDEYVEWALSEREDA